MNILFVTPEVFPFSRAGGLGDVSHHLPRSLAERGHRLWVITPKYRQAEESGIPMEPIGEAVLIPLSWKERRAQYFLARPFPGVEVILVGCEELYGRTGLYGNEYGDYEDNAERFIFFCRAAVEFARLQGLEPDIIHAHDWASGLTPILARSPGAGMDHLNRAASLYTFHNLGSQGIFWHYDFPMTGLDWSHFTPDGIEFHGQINLTKAGLVWADMVSTVSRKYAQEALTAGYGFGLEGVLQKRREDIHAVLNGVDYQVWDPARDPDIAARYSIENLHLKTECRRELVRLFGLEPSERPIVAVVSRLLDRKGLDLITGAMDRILSLPVSLVFMGQGEDRYHFALGELGKRNPDRVGVKIMYDQLLVHRIMAGADVFLMPSRYEPCGLEQLYSLKYGTIPVVRATGGLDDTVVDLGEFPENGTGFKFVDYTPDALVDALSAAVRLFENRPAWEIVMRRGMRQDFSWSRAAAEYERLYQAAVEKRGRI
jgi:starch synthase